MVVGRVALLRGESLIGLQSGGTFMDIPTLKSRKNLPLKNGGATICTKCRKSNFLQSFLSPGKAPFFGVKSSTAAHYHYTLQHYILPVLGSYRVQSLSETILENCLLEIIAPADQNHKTLGNAMSKECLTPVRRICRHAVHLHIMRPIEINFKPPNASSSNTSVLNNSEQKSVCA